MSRAIFGIRSYLLGLACIFAYGEACMAQLHERTRVTLQNSVIPAYLQGDSLSLLESLSPLVANMSDGQLAAIDGALSQEQLPPVSELLIDARMHAMLTADASKLPKTSPRESLLLLAALRERVLSAIKEQFKIATLDDSHIPEKVSDFDELLWDVHVARNEIANAQKAAEYAAYVKRQSRRISRRGLSDSDLAVLEHDFAALIDQTKHLTEQLSEVDLDLRMNRFLITARELRPDSEVRDKITAAFILGLDGPLLDEAFSNKQTDFERAFLQDVSQDTVRENAEIIREAAGDLVEKSRIFYAGLHWWFRGRYGAGVDGFGLLKSRAAMTNPNARFGLFMPTKTPTPTEPNSGYPVPTIDRRHHFVWAYEYRQSSRGKTNTEFSRSKTTYRKEIQLDRFY